MSFFFILSTLLMMNHHAEAVLVDENGKLQIQIEEIDQKIEELERVKRGYEAKAFRHENQGERKQFQQDQTLESRRHFQLAEQNRQIANQIQQDIDRLQSQKQELLKKNNRIGLKQDG